MKRTVPVLLFAALAAACGSSTPTSPSPTGPITFIAQISAASEVPPIANAEAGGRGSVTITMNVTRDGTGAVTGGGTVTFGLQLSGFPPGTPVVAAHIHPGAAGSNGPPLVSTGITQGTALLLADGTVTITLAPVNISATDAQAIAANPAGFYFNVHTQTNPGGAARGQLVRQ